MVDSPVEQRCLRTIHAVALGGGIAGMIGGFVAGIVLAKQLDRGYVDLPNLLGWALACGGAWAGVALGRTIAQRRRHRD